MSTRHSDNTPPVKDETHYARFGYIVLAGSFGALLLWSLLAPLQSAVVASGRILVASENRLVQHLDGGLVDRILVKDGDLVEAGQSLLVLDDQSLRIRLEQVTEQLLEVQANTERLEAERDGKQVLTFSQDLAQGIKALKSKILDTQQQLFASRRAALTSERRVHKQRKLQYEKQIIGSSKLIKTLRRRLVLLQKEYKALKPLAAKRVVAQTKLREVEGNLVALQGEIASQEGEIARLRESLSEIEFNAVLRDQEYNKEVISQLRDLQTQLINLDAEQREIADQLERVIVRAPVAGKVKGFKVVTRGAVLKAGQEIMEIVPQEREFKIHARISPMDIDSLYPGLHAEVRFPAFDGSQHFPSLFADLQDVSTDVYQPEGSEESFYKGSLTMDQASRETLAREKLELVSGMPVDVVIKTGERSLASYLVQPISDMLVRAFNES